MLVKAYIYQGDKIVTAQQHKADVVLVNMPFGSLFPSIGLGLLKSSLAPLNISTKVCYFTLKFIKQIGISLYIDIADGRHTSICDIVGEWIFSGTLFDSSPTDVENFIEDVLRGRSPAHKAAYPQIKPLSDSFIQDILHVRSLAPDFLHQCLQEVLNYQPRIVAFSSTFQQHTAALSLAKLIKEQEPNVFIEFGGANCQGLMGIEVIRQFPFVDAVISGEGDRVFPELVSRVLEKRPIYDLQGVFTQDTIHSTPNPLNLNAPTLHELDTLPFPDYEDYFLEWDAIHPHLTENFQPRLLFETSRGCWWGEKQHCTFCGLNGMEMAYRAKSATRAMDELLYLTNKYPNYPISVVDNILDMNYFKSFLPEIADRQLNLELFYEVKANLKKNQVRLLQDAGITLIQPGIESLSSHVLELMRKGIKGLQNIQLLKWCKELGITAFWNLLWGFPGETPEDYKQMAQIIPLLSHLRPPDMAGAIRIDRFSPNFIYSEQFGFQNVVPYPAYHYVYPLGDEAVANLAYFFAFNYRQPRDVEAYVQPVKEQVLAWQSAHATSALTFIDKGTKLQIWDLRPIAKQLLVNLPEPQRTLYLACDGIRSLHYLKQVVKEQLNQELSEGEIEEILQPLIEDGFMLREDNSFLSLAIPFTE
jgi:ribosomal peptide maturation radical SAM protein 1